MKVTHILISALLLSAMPAACQTTGTVPISDLVKHAESGDAQAQFEMGRAYEDGKGVPQDDDRAVEWFRKSAEQENAQAQNSLGAMYAEGRGVQREKEEAVRWYRKAAKRGLPEALYNIAIAYYNGEGVGGDINHAYTWMMAAARKGDAQAAEALNRMGEQMNNRVDRSKFDLAELYEKGEEVPQDTSASVALFLEVAQSSYRESASATSAQYKLCQLYMAGKGVAQDYAKAKSWCKKSGTSAAYMAMGNMAEKGLGQTRNPQEAMELYRNAALQGSLEAYMETARMKMEIGSHDEEKNAYFWYAIAARLELPGADAKLRETAAHVNEKEIAQEKVLVAKWPEMGVAERAKALKKH
jgi:TPR repeat protein